MKTLILAVMLLIPAGPPAQEGTPAGEDAPGTLSVARGVMALRVENREPVGEGGSFEPGVGQLTCYTVIEGAAEGTVIYHVWMHEDELVAKVQLPVRGSPWRTWSTKRILPGWIGAWTVRIEDADGSILKSLPFTIGEPSS